MLANLLGMARVDVVIIERNKGLVGLPRAIGLFWMHVRRSGIRTKEVQADLVGKTVAPTSRSMLVSRSLPVA